MSDLSEWAPAPDNTQSASNDLSDWHSDQSSSYPVQSQPQADNVGYFKNLMNQVTHMPKGIPEFQFGSPQNKELIHNMVNVAAGNPGEQLGQKIIPGLIKSGINKIFPTKSFIKNSLLNTHDALETGASNSFKTVSDLANQRGIAPVPEMKSVTDELRSYFPQTKQANSLLNDASTGNYNALRKLQSELYTRGKKNISSDLETDRMKGEEMMEKRNNINRYT